MKYTQRFDKWVRVSGPKNRKIGITCEVLKKISGTPTWRPRAPICTILALFALWRQMGVPTYFYRSFDIVDDFTKTLQVMV